MNDDWRWNGEPWRLPPTPRGCWQTLGWWINLRMGGYGMVALGTLCRKGDTA
jgi:hypothetical protein